MSSLPARYESFLFSNASTIGTIESSLHSLTWFLPGRFKDAELISEALNSVLNLLSLYHDTLLARRLALVKSNSKVPSELIPPSPHTRYTKAWSEKDALYRWSARGLEAIRFSQLVIEMILKRVTRRNGRWRGIVLLELAKAMLRLVLLQRTKRPLLSPPIPEREIDPTALPALDEVRATPESPPLKPTAARSAQTSEESAKLPTPQHLQNNNVPFSPSGKPHPFLSSLSDAPLTRTVIEDYLLPKALTPALVRSPTDLLTPLHAIRSLKGMGEWAGELLYVLRPLIFVLMLRPTASNNNRRGSTSINYNSSPKLSALRTPLAVSLLLSLLSRQLRRSPSSSTSSSGSLERTEYSRRDREILWHLFRGELWSEWTRPRLEAIQEKLGGKALFGLVSGLLADWIPLVDEYWYYTAT